MVEDTGFDSSPKDSIHGMISAQDAVTAGLRVEANAGEAEKLATSRRRFRD